VKRCNFCVSSFTRLCRYTSQARWKIIPSFNQTFLPKIIKIQLCILGLQLKMLGILFWDTVYNSHRNMPSLLWSSISQHLNHQTRATIDPSLTSLSFLSYLNPVRMFSYTTTYNYLIFYMSSSLPIDAATRLKPPCWRCCPTCTQLMMLIMWRFSVYLTAVLH